MPVWTDSGNKSGWNRDQVNNRQDFGYNGTRAGHITSTGMRLTGTLTVDGAQTFTGASTFSGAVDIAGLLSPAASMTVTGVIRAGAASAFATTQPVSALHMKAGTAPVGTTTTSGAVYTDGTTVKKIIADGTASDNQT